MSECSASSPIAIAAITEVRWLDGVRFFTFKRPKVYSWNRQLTLIVEYRLNF